MATSQLNQLLAEARQKLTQNPFDAGHDLSHAEAVWATSQEIVNHLHLDPGSSEDPGSDHPHLDALQIACFWHDVVVKPPDKLNPAGENVADTADYLKSRMKVLNFPPTFIRLTVDAVRYHQFNDVPVNLEGRILWDADKLEALNLDRWLAAKKAVDQGKMSSDKLDSYINTALEWLKVLRSKYHFDYSRSLFDKRLKILTSNPELQALAYEKGINFQSLVINHQP